MQDCHDGAVCSAAPQCGSRALRSCDLTDEALATTSLDEGVGAAAAAAGLTRSLGCLKSRCARPGVRAPLQLGPSLLAAGN